MATTNIRVLLQVRWTFEQIEAFLVAHPAWIQKIVRNHAAAFTVIRHEQPQIDLTRLEFWLMAPSKESATADDERVKRGNVSRQIRFEPKPFDRSLIEMLDVGHLDQTVFQDAVEQLKKSQLDGDVKAALEQLWKRFHGNFIVQQEEVIKEFREFYRVYRDKLGVENIMSLAKALAMIGVKDEENVWMNEWCQEVLPKLSTEAVEAIIQWARGDLPAQLMSRLNDRLRNDAESVPFSEIVKKMIVRASWNERDVAVLAVVSASSIEQWVLEDTDANLIDVLRRAVRMFRPDSDNESFRAFGNNLRIALGNVSKRSSLDKVRVTQYVNVDVKQGGNEPQELQ